MKIFPAYVGVVLWTLISFHVAAQIGSEPADTFSIGHQLTKLKTEKRWSEFAALRDTQIIAHPPTGGDIFASNGTWILNSDAWEVFLHCTDTIVINRAVAWVELAISLEQTQPVTQYFDTKANLLYKLGRVEEAIACEQQAIDVGIEQAKKAGREKGDFFDEYTETLNKMKKRLPTW